MAKAYKGTDVTCKNPLDVEVKTAKKERVNDEVSGAASNSGYRGAASNSGVRGTASNSGVSGAASNSGDSGAASNSGKYGVAVAWGILSRAMLSHPDSYMVLGDWRTKDSEWYLHKAHLAKIGQEIAGVKILADTWYWFENGKLKSEKNNA